MRQKLFFIRKFKALFVRWKLHRLLEPISGFMLNILYLSKASKWIHSQPNKYWNDFYSKQWDYQKRYDLYAHIFENESLSNEITYLEFGVAQGFSFKWWVEHNQHIQSQFHGFDTFEGLPEQWGDFEKGAMSTQSAVPNIQDPRVQFHKGLFQETVPKFLSSFEKKGKLIIHCDADLYSSTVYVLTQFEKYLTAGDIILFDEFLVPQHEFLAFIDVTRSYYLELEIIAAANNYFFVAFRKK